MGARMHAYQDEHDEVNGDPRRLRRLHLIHDTRPPLQGDNLQDSHDGGADVVEADNALVAALAQGQALVRRRAEGNPSPRFLGADAPAGKDQPSSDGVALLPAGALEALLWLSFS